MNRLLIKAVVAPEERAVLLTPDAADRSSGTLLSPVLTGVFLSILGLFSALFFLCGGLKIVYYVLFNRGFQTVKPPEESN